MLTYQKRISFDSINPNKEFLPDEPPYIPPQYQNQQQQTQTKRQLDLSFGYEPTAKSDVQKVFDSFNELGHNSKSTAAYGAKKKKKAPRLPPPPKKSILKNNDGAGPGTLVQLSTSAPRKKSIVDMTTEELLALDQQFRKGVDLTNLKFDGDGYLPFQSLASIENKKVTKQIQKIDKMMSSIAKQKNSLSDLNFSSYSSSYKHLDYKRYVNSRIAPRSSRDSLRDIVVYVSGRKHTWDAINWCFKNYLEDGDHLVIVCRIPKNGDEGSSNAIHDSDDEEELEDIKISVENLKNYVFKVIELLGLDDLKISLSLEFIKESSVKNVLKQIVQFYDPHVFVISSLLTQLNFKSARKILKLPSYIMKNLNIPVITIPDLIIDESLVSLIKPSPIPILVEGEKEAVGAGDISPNDESPIARNDYFTSKPDHSNDFLDRLNTISDKIDRNKNSEPIEFLSSTTRSYTSRSEPIVSIPQLSKSTTRTSSISRISETHSEPQSYFPDNYKLGQPSIKFSHDLKVPRSTTSGSSGSSTRRNSGNNGIYKVKSLLDDDTPTERSKSVGNTLNNTLSNELERRKSSGGGSIKQTVSAPPPEKKEKKSALFGFLKKKK